jgi:large subunit ribosomal protein L3
MTEEAKQQDNATPESSAPAVATAPLKGLVGTKVGMTRVFNDDGQMVPVTVVSAEGLVITQIKTKESDGYNAVQVGYHDVLEKRSNKPEAQHLLKNKISPKRFLREFRVKDVAPFKIGQPVPVTVFAKGEWVQVSGTTRGKGYAGVIKRHGFHGLRHSHGNGEYRRHPGSSSAQGPQHVLPGTRKPGHMGNVWSTVPKIEVIDVDVERSLILLRGSIPGPNGNFVVLKPTSRAVKAAAAASPTKAKKK